MSMAYLLTLTTHIISLQNIIAALTGGGTGGGTGGTGGGTGGRSASGRSLSYSTEPDYSDLYRLDMATEITQQFMSALYKYSQP